MNTEEKIIKYLCSINGTTTKWHDREILLKFGIARNRHNTHIEIIIDDSDKNYFGCFWNLKHEGFLEPVKNIMRESTKSETYPNGYYHIVGSSTYSKQPCIHENMNGAIITIMISK